MHIATDLINELKDIIKEVKPDEILLTVDAMTGQDAVTVAETFNKELNITGVILTKLDGDTRGGAALSIKYITGKPIKFCGVGEKMDDIEPFYPDRMASRILDMGDVLTLIEKAQETFDEEEAKKMEKKLRENSFTLSDYLVQFEQIKKMGDLGGILSLIPGAGKIKNAINQIDPKQIEHVKAIILSMTPEEREHPEMIKGSRKQRIANGSGRSIQDVNQLLKQYEQTKEMMKQFKNKKFGGFGRFPF